MGFFEWLHHSVDELDERLNARDLPFDLVERAYLAREWLLELAAEEVYGA